MTDEQKTVRDAAKGIAPKQAGASGPLAVFLGLTTCIFFFLLILSGIKHLRDGRFIAELTTRSAPARPTDLPPSGPPSHDCPETASAPSTESNQTPGTAPTPTPDA
jgi:hypothetical protein